MLTPIELAERGFAPDFAIRAGIRNLLKVRLRQCAGPSLDAAWDATRSFYTAMDRAPLAIHSAEANIQHYEVPTVFYDYCLGPRKKYSSCYFKNGQETLAQAEDAMLDLTCGRAQLADGQRILELGCGWGSLSLWMAEHYPRSQITAVSNSRSQREYIESKAKSKNLTNLMVITSDMNDLRFDRSDAQAFDRVVSVEMFEHMRNWRELFSRVASWLTPDGKLFFHIFVHRCFTYPFETVGEDDWMGRHFFTGGVMPSFDLPLRFQEHLMMVDQWQVSGTHYGKTAEWWLVNLDRHRQEVLDVFNKFPHPGGDSSSVVMNRWRIFFMACAELWNFDDGREWFVGHYLFNKRRPT